MEKAMTDVGYDVKKLPLGNLTEATVKNGYDVLKKLDVIMKNINSKKTTMDKELSDIKKLSGLFYTYIPHNFGFQRMENFILKTDAQIKQKFDLISNLEDINTAINLQKKGVKPKNATLKK